MRLFLPVAALICITACRAPRKIVLDTYKKNETIKEYKEILITGEGGMQAKMYLQNLTDELNRQLAKSNIHSHYAYLGDSRKLDTDEAFEKAKAGQYDAVMRIVPRVTKEVVYRQNTSYDPYNGNVSHDFADYKHVNEHINEFDLTLKEKTDAVIWQASLKTDIDPIAKNIYKGISDKVIDVLTENLIVPVK
jgi:hypothetical protein